METAGVYDGNRSKIRLSSIEDTLKDFCGELLYPPQNTFWENGNYSPSYWHSGFTNSLSKVSKQLGRLGCLNKDSKEYQEFAAFVRKYLGKTILTELESDQILYQPNLSGELNWKHIQSSHPNVYEVLCRKRPMIYPGKLVLFRMSNKDIGENYFVRMRHECYFPQHLNIIGHFLEELKGEGIDLNDLCLEQEVGHGVVTLIDTRNTGGSWIITLGGASYGINARTKEIEIYGESKAIGCSQKVREQMAGILREKSGRNTAVVEDIIGLG